MMMTMTVKWPSSARRRIVGLFVQQRLGGGGGACYCAAPSSSYSRTSSFLSAAAADYYYYFPNYMLRQRHPMQPPHRALLLSSRQSSSSGRGTATDDGRGDKEADGDPVDDSQDMAGMFKNPIVQQLWKARQQAKALSRQQKMKNSKTNRKGGRGRPPSSSSHPVTPMGKSPQDSQVSVTYQFGSDTFLREAYRNPWGQMRLGRLMEDLDALAGNIAYFHVSPKPSIVDADIVDEGEARASDDILTDDNMDDTDLNPVIVTASVDRIQLRRPVPDMTRNQELSGCVTWTGTSSMEIRMQCCCQSQDAAQGAATTAEDPWLVAYVTFVTLHPITHKPMAIAPVLPTTPLEQERFEAGARRASMKKLKRQRKSGGRATSPDDSNELETLAESLLKEAGPLLTLPSLADPHSILMAQTKMQNAQVAQPQVQNLHRRIFGGFLLRRAFELGFANAYLFGGALPLFLEVDEVSFQSPVDVGDLLVFNSRVLYTEPDGVLLSDYYHQDTSTSTSTMSSTTAKLPVVHVEVECWVTEPEKAQARLSNQFYFTFAVRSSTKSKSSSSTTEEAVTSAPLPILPPIRKVLPSNIDEARRMASRILGDREQHQQLHHRHH